ncbi:MAG TPA: PilZ domain-containing protein [Beijerinckiaceae bacterium]|nr:PilZ domain-containing protein [Beijerinckiaceae bacterium]
MDDNKRISPRLRSFLKGRVIYNGGQTNLECLIRDISSTGARLEFSSSVTLPDRFDLYLPHREETCKAHIQWRRGEEIGVAFDSIESAAPPSPAPPAAPAPVQDVAARVQQLEAEAGLTRMLLTQMRAELDSLKAEIGLVARANGTKGAA